MAENEENSEEVNKSPVLILIVVVVLFLLVGL